MKKYLEIIGCLLLAIVMYIYLDSNNNPVSNSELICVDGKLKEKPFHQEGFDIQSYIRINLNDDNRNYELTDCAYDASTKESILNLQPGNDLKIFIKQEDKNNSKVNVFALICNGSKVLNLDDFNQCYTTRGQKFKPLIIILVGFFC